MLHNMLRAAAGNRGGIPTDGLVAWYTMDNISGSTLIDEQGTYDGTISGFPAFNAGIIGNAIDFAGNSGYVGSFGMSGVLLDAYSFWFYTPVEITASTSFEVHGTISTLHGSFGSGSAAVAISGETFFVTVFSSSTSDYRYYYIRDNIPAGWNHIVFNWSGSTYEFWLNNSKATTYIYDKGSGFPTGRLDLQYYTIGKRYNYTQYSTKKHDQVRIYSNSGTGLSSEDISLLYNEGA